MSFVKFGTAQPQGDISQLKATDRNKHLPVHLQQVRDDQGRQRLHGAFQGGFSAGYYNTVGSKEGWEPKQFKSSKGSAVRGSTNIIRSRPQDFMDEEDVQEFGARVAMNTDYEIVDSSSIRIPMGQQDFGSSIMERRSNSNNKNTIPSLMDNSIFQDLMGPPTDAIGLRMLKNMGWSEGQNIGDSKLKSTVSNLVAKANQFGLDFDPFLKNPELAHRTSVVQDAGKNNNGFGIGIFELEDDEEVYEAQNTSQYNLELEDEVDSNLAKRKIAHPLTKGNLDGFTLVKKSLPPVIKYYTPLVRADFLPKPPLMRKSEKYIPTSETKSTADQSIFSMISLKDRNHIQNTIANNHFKILYISFLLF